MRFSIMKDRGPPSIAFLILIVSVLLPSVPAEVAHAHVGEGGKGWMLSAYVAGNLKLIPDSSLSQWKSARMTAVETLDMVLMNLMTVHNDSYIIFLAQRGLNTSLDRAGVIIAFEGAGRNGTDVVWRWVGGKINSSMDPQVKSVAGMTAGVLTVVFGRELNSSSVAFSLGVGRLYPDFVKITAWSNTASVVLPSLEELAHINLELLPNLDTYPKAPLVYSAILLAVTIVLVWNESKEYR